MGAGVGPSSHGGVVGPLSSLSISALLPLSPVSKNFASSVFAQEGQPLSRSHSDHAAYFSLTAEQMPLASVSDAIQGDESGTVILEESDGTKTPPMSHVSSGVGNPPASPPYATKTTGLDERRNGDDQLPCASADEAGGESDGAVGLFAQWPAETPRRDGGESPKREASHVHDGVNACQPGVVDSPSTTSSASPTSRPASPQAPLYEATSPSPSPSQSIVQQQQPADASPSNIMRENVGGDQAKLGTNRCVTSRTQELMNAASNISNGADIGGGGSGVGSSSSSSSVNHSSVSNVAAPSLFNTTTTTSASGNSTTAASGGKEKFALPLESFGCIVGVKLSQAIYYLKSMDKVLETLQSLAHVTKHVLPQHRRVGIRMPPSPSPPPPETVLPPVTLEEMSQERSRSVSAAGGSVDESSVLLF